MSASFSEDQYKTDTMNPIKAQAVPSAPPAVKGSYRSVSQGYDNVPDIEIGAGDAVDAHVQRQMRLGFIRKVYGILATPARADDHRVCSVLALNGACRRFVMTTPSLMYIGKLHVLFLCLRRAASGSQSPRLTPSTRRNAGMFGSFGVLFALMAFKNQHPLNAQLLFVWTLMEAGIPLALCAPLHGRWARTDRRRGAWCSRRRYSQYLTAHTVPILEAGLVLHGSWSHVGPAPPHFLGLVLVVLPGAGGRLYSLLGALIFSGFIIFDTWQITERHRLARPWRSHAVSRHPLRFRRSCRRVPLHPEALSRVATTAQISIIMFNLIGAFVIPMLAHDDDGAPAGAPADRTRRAPRRPRCFWLQLSRRLPPRPPPVKLGGGNGAVGLGRRPPAALT